MISSLSKIILTWTWSFTFHLPLLKLLVPARKSESYSSLKEKRKSLTPVIIVLSPSSHILLAECLTDPAGKSFTPHLLRQPSHERSFYLPASVSHSFCLSNCSLCSCSSVRAEEHNSLFFFSNYPSPEACHQHSFENDFTGPSSHTCCLSGFPGSQALPCSCDRPPLGGPQSVFGSRSSHSRTRSCLTVLPRRIPPCRLSDLITMPASRRERRWLTLHWAISLPSLCVVCRLSASFSFIKRKSPPLHHRPQHASIPLLPLLNPPQCGC